MSAPTRLVLIGHPVAHSLSPRVQNAALAAAGIDVKYSAIDVLPHDLANTLHILRGEGAAGNVTIPHKESVYARCDRVTPIASAAGAVNTFWFEGEELVGTNTDVGGFDRSVRDLMAQHGRPLPLRVSIIGAGGSAAAVALAASQWPATVTIWARNEVAAEKLAGRFDCARAEPDLATAVARAELVVNATPIGLRDECFPVALDMLTAHAAVVDLVYRPMDETAWVRAARFADHPAADGLPMLIEQAALAFECWFGAPADRRVMWDAAKGR